MDKGGVHVMEVGSTLSRCVHEPVAWLWLVPSPGLLTEIRNLVESKSSTSCSPTSPTNSVPLPPFLHQSNHYTTYSSTSPAPSIIMGLPEQSSQIVATPPAPSPDPPIYTSRQQDPFTSLSALQTVSQPVDCPACHKRDMTRTRYSAGSYTQ